MSDRPPATMRPPRRAPFGTAPDGSPVEVVTLANARGTVLRAMTFGAVVLSFEVRDREGRLDDIVLGYDALDGYLAESPYFGAVVGRYGNRIARGRFTLDGEAVQLVVNDGVNHLHGGTRGFDRCNWRLEAADASRVTFALTSPDGDQGYPGTIEARVRYALGEDDALTVDFEAVADRATPVNLTQHSYFNLAGAGRGDVLGHRLTLHADGFTPVDAGLVPTGEIAPVAGTPFDFRAPAAIGARIDADHPQLRLARGYDHNFVLARPRGAGGALAHAAHVEEPCSGRTLDVHTTEPGVQLYTGNFLDGSIRGKAARVYGPRAGFCLETQHFPDSPNHPEFPTTILRPGAAYRSRTVFAFGIATG